MSFAITDVPAELVRDTRDQRLATLAAIRSGDALKASPPQQRAARQAHLRRRWPSAMITEEGTVGGDDTLWSSYLARGADCVRAVGRVCWADEPEQSRANGTGFLIAESVLITNAHILGSREEAADSVVEMGYEYAMDGMPTPVKKLRLEPDRLFISSVEMDFTLVAVEAASASRTAGQEYGYLPLTDARAKVRNGEPLNVIHHPGGGLKKVTIRESRVLAMDETTLSYSGDTLSGSSGSPVLNDQWEVVALHYGGSPKRDTQDRILTTDGRIWEPELPDSLKAYEFNVGRRASSIVQSLRRRQPHQAEARGLLASVITSGGVR